jgi:hypothetical protein
VAVRDYTPEIPQPEDTTWRSLRLRMHQTRAPVWVGEAWWADAKLDTTRPAWLHYPYISAQEHGMISYTKSLDHGRRGIQTRTKPGRYLTTYFDHVLSEGEIRNLVQWQNAKQLKSEYDDAEKYPLLIAMDGGGIATAYRDGPASCMGGRHFEFEKHPTRAYAAGDLGIAYFRDTNTNKVVARALVWPAKKIMGRVYPTVENWEHDGFKSRSEAERCNNALLTRLQGEGYRPALSDKSGSFNGAKLARVLFDRDNNAYMLPFLDWGYGIVDKDTHFEMQRGTIEYGSSTTGYVIIQDFGDCNRCNNRIRGNNQYVYSTVDITGGHGRQNWCRSCVQSNSVRTCSGFHIYVVQEGNEFVNAHGPYYSRGYVDRFPNDFYRSDYSGEWFADAHSRRVRMGNGQTWSREEYNAHGFRCALTNRLMPKASRHALYPEIAQDCEASAEFADYVSRRAAPSVDQEKAAIEKSRKRTAPRKKTADVIAAYRLDRLNAEAVDAEYVAAATMQAVQMQRRWGCHHYADVHIGPEPLSPSTITSLTGCFPMPRWYQIDHIANPVPTEDGNE